MFTFKRDQSRWARGFLGCVMGLFACGGGEATNETSSAADEACDAPLLEASLEALSTAEEACDAPLLEASLEDNLAQALETYQGNPGWLMAARAPTFGLDFHAAIGTAPDGSTPLDPAAPFRIASVTKTFVAAATLRLVEDDALSLDDTVVDVVPAPFPQILTSGGYDPGAITVRHLLTHTSGLYDYAADSDFIAAVFADPSHVWTREEQVHFAIEHGEPLGPPGEQFSYSDTGYVLLGAVLESKTGHNMGAALRSLLDYDAIGLTTTWLEKIESVPPGAAPLLPQVVGDLAVADIDASVDLWGGGGLVSTTTDLERFFRALLTGNVFHSANTLATMKTIPKVSREAHAAMGIFQAKIGDAKCWAHSGVWGVGAAFCPSEDLGVSVAGVEAISALEGVRPLVEESVGIVSGCDD